MDKNKRMIAAAAAAAAGLFLAGCDNSEPEEPAEVPAESVPENQMAESEMAADPGAGDAGADGDEPTAADAEDMMPADEPGEGAGEGAVDPEAETGG